MTEFDTLDPEEMNDPKSMQLWIGRLGTPLPTAWNSGIDLAFQFAGMVRRDVQGRLREPVALTLNESTGPFRAVGEPRLTLTWPRLLRQHAAVLPAGVHVSVVCAMPAPEDRTLIVMPRVRFGLLDLGLPLRRRPGYPATCVAEPETETTAPFRAAITAFTGPALVAVAR